MTTSDPGNVLPTAVTEAGPSAAYREVEQLLRGAGWTDCGAGDWAFALASPDGALAARISPFDPVGPYTARLYERAAGTGLVPRMLLHHRLAGGADLLVMEQLLSVGESDAHAFLAAFSRAEGELGALASVVQAIHAEARRELYWCGPLDTNPSNIMRRPAGAGPRTRAVLTDPFYADGPNLYAMAEEDPDRFVTTLPAHERQHLTEIPLACSGPWPDEAREGLRARLLSADQRAASRG